MIPSKIRKETRMTTIPTPIQHSTGIPSQSNKARISLFADDMILYFKDRKTLPKKS
jgi:hypothetical protein